LRRVAVRKHTRLPAIHLIDAEQVSDDAPAWLLGEIAGALGGEELCWQVTSADGREHFFVFASPQGAQQFEDSVAMLPRPQLDKPVVSAVLPRQESERFAASVVWPRPSRSTPNPPGKDRF
jgi:hypothetical protein